MIEHKHDYKLIKTAYGFPETGSGTPRAVEYAYLLCACTKVIKVAINE